jgi:flagellar basal-body rod protein FlgB
MDPSRIALFDLADQRLAHIGRRQEVLAQNIANADTPGWRARDLKSFSEILARGTGGVAPWRTVSRHLAPTRGAGPQGHAQSGERAPDGNSVALDTELAKVADTESSHSLVTGLYQKYLAMFRTAAGR